MVVRLEHALFVSDFSNPVDLVFLKQIMEDEGIDPILRSPDQMLTFMNQFRNFHQFQGTPLTHQRFWTNLFPLSLI